MYLQRCEMSGLLTGLPFLHRRGRGTDVGADGEEEGERAVAGWDVGRGGGEDFEIASLPLTT